MIHNNDMYNTKQTGERGLIKWILLIIVALVLASYFFDFSVKEAVEDEQTQSNFEYIQTNTTDFWNEHLKSTADYLWNNVFIDLIWESFVENMERLKDGENTVFEDSSPGVDVQTTQDDTNDPVTAGYTDSE